MRLHLRKCFKLELESELNYKICYKGLHVRRGGGTQCKSSRFYYVPVIFFSLDLCSHVAHIFLLDIQLMFIEPHAGLRVCPLFMVWCGGGYSKKNIPRSILLQKIN